MKFAIHLSTLCERWDEDLSPHLVRVKELGYDGVEFPLLDPFNFPIERYASLLKGLNLQGLCSTGLGPDTDIGSYQPIIAEQGIDHLKRCIDIAHQIGSPYLTGVTYAPWGEFHVREKNEERFQRMIQNMRIVLEYAETKGVSVYFELINRFETSWLNTVDDGLNYVAQLDAEPVGLHLDTFHANIEEKSIPEAIRKGGKWLKHIHFAENDRGIPTTGSIDWQGIKQALHDINYDGWISLECFTSPRGDVGLGTNTWRLIETDAYNVAKEGLKAMKRVMSK